MYELLEKSSFVHSRAGRHCVCLAGLEGVNCSSNVENCFNNTCLNGGNCTDLIDDYQCHCILGFKGICY